MGELERRLRGWEGRTACEMSDGQLTGAEQLMGLWERYGRAMNLTGARHESALADQAMDGFEAVWCARQCGVVSGTWVDVGSGAGLPGLIAAICGFYVELIEPRERRASFLTLALASMGLQGVVRRQRWNGEQSEANVLSARAVFSPSQWLEAAKRAAKRNAVVLVHTTVETRSELPPVTAAVEGKLGVVCGYRIE